MLRISDFQKMILQQTLIVMTMYSFFRCLFLVYNWSIYKVYSFSSLFECLVVGLRFDLSTVCMLSAPIFLLGFVPQAWSKEPWFQRGLRFLFVTLHGGFFFANLADMEYYGFTGTRLTLRIFGLQQDVAAQSGQIVARFWYLILIGFLFCYWIAKYPRLSNKPRVVSHLHYYCVQFLMLVLAVLAMRGGLQTKVLKPVHAFNSGHPELGVLTLNSTFTMLKGKLKNEISEENYFVDKSEVKSWLVGNKSVEPLPISSPGHNVVILILESSATEFWGAANNGKGYTPFLDSLTQKKGSLFFKNNFANGRRSMDALPAILFGIPNLMNTALAKSDFYSNEWRGFGKLLVDEGYSTHFFHGAPRGSMYFDSVAKLAGIQNYYGMKDYSVDKKNHDGHWGIFDEPFLKYMVETLDGVKSPFLSVAFTLTSHNPYPIPEALQGKFPKGSLPVHEGIGYTDYSVQKFFEQAAKTDWYNNTLFIITGDHTERSDTLKYMNSIGRYRVPLLLYHPQFDEPSKQAWSQVDLEKVTQHADILPTALHFLGYENKIPNYFGHSVFEPQVGKALLYSDENYWWVEKTKFAHLLPDGQVSVYRFDSDSMEKNPLLLNSEEEQRWRNKIRAQIQYFRNGLIRNDLYSY